MIIPVLAAVLTVALQCAADDNAAVMDQLEDIISENILDEVAEDDNSEVAAAVKYMIPIPIRVVVPVPQQQPIRQPVPERETEFEQEPIVAVPIGATPGRYGPTWRPIGPPVIAVPVGSASAPYPYRDPYRRSPGRLSAPRAASRKTRSIDEEELQAEQHEQGGLTSDITPKEVPAKGIHGIDNPLKVSTKMRKGLKSDKLYRPKRQTGYYGYVRSGYTRPARVIVAPQQAGQVVVAQPGQVVVSPMQGTPVVPVPVYVPVPVETV